jgi:hypothetical protein
MAALGLVLSTSIEDPNKDSNIQGNSWGHDSSVVTVGATPACSILLLDYVTWYLWKSK